MAVSLRFKQTLPDLPRDYATLVDEFAVDPTLSEPGAGNDIRAGGRVPQLNIVVMLVGSQGTRLKIQWMYALPTDLQSSQEM